MYPFFHSTRSPRYARTGLGSMHSPFRPNSNGQTELLQRVVAQRVKSLERPIGEQPNGKEEQTKLREQREQQQRAFREAAQSKMEQQAESLKSAAEQQQKAIKELMEKIRESDQKFRELELKRKKRKEEEAQAFSELYGERQRLIEQITMAEQRQNHARNKLIHLTRRTLA